VTAPSSTRPRALVVGYVDSVEGNAALEEAVTLARLLEANLHIVHVVDLADFPIDPDSGDWEEQGLARLALIREHALGRVASLPGHSTYVEAAGPPAQVLRDAAFEHAAMMVVVGVGSGTGNPLARLMSRGVTRSLIRHVECPVLLVPRSR
jgi:nucleotide-binding universal stress UspA family protein